MVTVIKPSLIINSIETLESTYHALIPISKHMGIRVKSFDGESLVLSAPLAENINHQQSVFGGSLFSVAALAGWGILQLKFGELSLACNTVIANGDVTYSRPVFGDFECTCTLPGSFDAFLHALRSTGKSGLMLKADIHLADKLAMSVEGNYVVNQLEPVA